MGKLLELSFYEINPVSSQLNNRYFLMFTSREPSLLENSQGGNIKYCEMR